MAKAQFNIRLDPLLANKLRREAQRRQQTPGVLVAEAIELLLSGNSPPAKPLSADSEGLAKALAALTERVAKLESKPLPKPVAELVAPIEAPVGAITTAELAERTSTNRAGWNNWASAERIGHIRNHADAGPWRLIGKAAAAEGGPERWLWEQG